MQRLAAIGLVGLAVVSALLVAGSCRNDLLINVVSAVGEWGIVFVIYWELENSRKAEIKKTTTEIFREWWDLEMDKCRKYFFMEFVPKYRAGLVRDQSKSMKDLDQVNNGCEAKKLCYFFDRVGWLGAAGLIDVDYVLGPMQHALRRAWWAMEPLIERARETSPGKRLDPVFQYGFEWLYERSSLPTKHQAELLRDRFKRPKIRSAVQIEALRRAIDLDEENFRDEMRKAV